MAVLMANLPKKGQYRFQEMPICQRGHDKNITGKGPDGTCLVCRREYHRQWKIRFRAVHPDLNKKTVAAWRKRNPTEWARQHSLSTIKRRARGKVCFGQDGIREFYENRPVGFEVDHVIPLQGKTVSGLHVIWNLQYLSAFQNKSKGNKYER
jgi:hypothetical protein